MQITDNNTPSLLDFSPVRRLYILFLLAHRNKKSVDSLNEETRDYVYSSLTPSAKRFVEKSIIEFTSEPYSTMLRDILDGDFAPATVQLRRGIGSDYTMLRMFLNPIIQEMETLTLLGFPFEIVRREFDVAREGRDFNFRSWDVRGFLHFHCNLNSDDGWKPEYIEPLAEYFSKSDILSKYYRPFIDLVSGAKSIITILAELGCWGIYEDYLKQNLYIIEGIAIEKSLNSVDLGKVKKSLNYLQLAGLASSHRARSLRVRPTVFYKFEHLPTMLSRDRYLKKQLSDKKINNPALLFPAEETLKPERQLITAKSNGDKGNGVAHN